MISNGSLISIEVIAERLRRELAQLVLEIPHGDYLLTLRKEEQERWARLVIRITEAVLILTGGRQ